MKANEKESIRSVSRSEWMDARRELLKKEKELTRVRDLVSEERMALPAVEVESDYQFETENGIRSLGSLFGGRSQLMVYHFMFGPGWGEGCKSCSCIADGFDSLIPHLAARDVTLLAVSRAKLSELQPFKKRMGWKFEWASSNACRFNRDFNVHFTTEEVESGGTYYNYGKNAYQSEDAHGISVFRRSDDGKIYHTYSSFARGLDTLLGVYNYLDIAPKGRDEADLSYGMEWMRHHDKYESGE